MFKEFLTITPSCCLGIGYCLDWHSFYAEVCLACFRNLKPIGGEGIKVEISETLITRGKYEKGRILKSKSNLEVGPIELDNE